MIGGTDVEEECDSLTEMGVLDVLVATPARLIQHLTSTEGDFKRVFRTLRMLVIDEVDRLMDNQFYAQLTKVSPDLLSCCVAMSADDMTSSLCCTAPSPSIPMLHCHAIMARAAWHCVAMSPLLHAPVLRGCAAPRVHDPGGRPVQHGDMGAWPPGASHGTQHSLQPSNIMPMGNDARINGSKCRDATWF